MTKAFETEVCVIGAGPAGLVASIVLAMAEVPFVLVDAGDGPVTESRALIVHAGGMEVLAELGVVEELTDVGQKASTFRVCSRGRTLATIPWHTVDSPYPFVLLVPQYRTEAALLRRLAELGSKPRYGHRVHDVRATAGGYEITGDDFSVQARHVVGADGLGSTVRQKLGITLPDHTYDKAFLLGDVTIDAALDPGQAHIFLSRHGLLFLGPMGNGQWRLIISIPDAERSSEPTIEAMQRHVDQRGSGDIVLRELTWASAFPVHHGVVDRFGVGSAAIIGDAAHVHSPAGGQGMNTGIQDAYDVAATIVAVHRGSDPATAMDGFRRRRLATGRQVVGFTDRVHRVLTLDSLPAHLVRVAIVRLLSRFGPVRRRVARLVSSVDRTPMATGAVSIASGRQGSPAEP